MVMTASVFDDIRDIVYKQTGITLQKGKETMVSARLAKRLRALSLPDEGAYVKYLRDHLEEEMPALVDVISTNVTSFFREADHFDVLSAQLKIWIAAGQSRFRFWSAASSTGEEPYTLAITLLELARGLGKKLDLKILATDLSNRVLKEASRGEYAEARLKGVNKGLQSRYFRPAPGDDKKTVCVADEVRSMVSFHRLNLSQIPYAMKGPLDAIFVRNVMIYFDDKGRDDVVGECHRMLRPDGLLIVGKSESLVRSGELFDRAAPSVYRKRDS